VKVVKIEAKSNSNIALIKYWGKRDESLFLPTKSSVSVTLDKLKTYTKIGAEKLSPDPKTYQGVKRFLKFFEKNFDVSKKLYVTSENHFPTKAGLASSASGYSALASGLDKFFNLNLSKKELSILARQGSGSAARSIYGGFVIWHKGKKADGSDSFAEQLFDQSHWPEFRVIVAILDKNEKKIGSRTAMQQTVKTSNFYNQWVKKSESQIPKIIEAIKNKDVRSVGQIAETDALEMHFCMQTSKPSINYWTKNTLDTLILIRKLRAKNIDCYFTIDAGPNVKIITLQKSVDRILQELQSNIKIQETIVCGVGHGVRAGALPAKPDHVKI